jgi:hypothetical protein
MCTWIHYDQLAKGVPLAGLLPVLVVDFVVLSYAETLKNNLKQVSW